MKKKKILAILLAGAVGLSAVPAAILAEEENIDFVAADVFFGGDDLSYDEGSDLSFDESDWGSNVGEEGDIETPETPAQDVPAEPATQDTETPEVPDTPETQAPETQDTETPEVTEAPETQAPAEPETQAPVEPETQAPVTETTAIETTSEVSTEVTTETSTEATTEAATDKPVQFLYRDTDGKNVLLGSYDTLKEAIDAYAADESGRTFVAMLTKDEAITETISIPSSLNVIVNSNAPSVTLSRGENLTGTMFAVSGRLQLGVPKDEAYALTLDGYSSAEGVNGALVTVMSGGQLGLQRGVTLTRNNTTAPGSGVYAMSGARGVWLDGCRILNNTTANENGAGVFFDDDFSTGEESGSYFYISTSTGPVFVSGNNVVGGKLANISIPASTAITVRDSLEGSFMGLVVRGQQAGLTVIKPEMDLEGEELTLALAQAVQTFNYDDPDYYIGLDGVLVSTAGPTIAPETPTPVPVTDIPTPIPTLAPDTPTPTPFIPTSTPIPTITMAPIITSTPVPTATPTPSTRAPYVPDIKECKVTGLDQPMEFPRGVFHEFSVTGASASDRYDTLVVGDGRWVPVYWSMTEGATSGETSWRIGTTSGIYESENKTYTLYIYCRLYTWNGSGWQDAGTTSSFPKQFTALKITPVPSGAVTATPTPSVTRGASGGGSSSSGSSTYTTTTTSGTDYVALTRAAQQSEAAGTVATTASVARTGDDSPIGVFLLLATLSLMAGIYVVIRKKRA